MATKPKTRKDIKNKEIKKKARNEALLKEYEANIKAHLDSSIGEIANLYAQIKAYKPPKHILEVEHKVEGLNALKSQINTLEERIKDIDLPEEVKLSKTITHETTFKNKTKKWLLIFSSVALIVMSTGVWLSFTNYDRGYKKGVKAGVKHSLYILDKNGYKKASKTLSKKTPDEYVPVEHLLKNF